MLTAALITALREAVMSNQEEFVKAQHVVHVYPEAEQASGDLFSEV